MKSKSPERFSFHELKSALDYVKTEKSPAMFIGKDMAMLA